MWSKYKSSSLLISRVTMQINFIVERSIIKFIHQDLLDYKTNK